MISAKRAALAGLTAAAVSGLAGCGGGGANGASGVRSKGDIVLVGHTEALTPGSLTAGQIAAADTAFGFALFDKLCTAAPTVNLTISPASAAQALGMLDAGSVGRTRDAISRLLRLPGWSPAVVAALNAQTAALSQISQVTVANHVFEQQGVTPTAATLNDLQTAYRADLRQVNFGDEPATTDTINGVISDDTDHLIPSLFGQSLPASTRTVLANAILLDAKWSQPFPTSAPGAFTTAAGTSVSATLMQNAEGEFAGRTSGGWQSVVLPYVGSLQAVALLPPVQAGQGCATPSAATLSALTSGASRGVGVVLPQLDLSQTLPLTSTLAAMGLPLNGNYAGLGSGDNEISEVIQKVVMKVDKSGTKAAAATGLSIATSARVGGQTVTFNRPFLLLLEDAATHTPLFLARVADPTQQ